MKKHLLKPTSAVLALLLLLSLVGCRIEQAPPSPSMTDPKPSGSTLTGELGAPIRFDVHLGGSEDMKLNQPYLITSRDELQKHCVHTYASSRYDDAFFEKNILVAVDISASSGSYRYLVSGVEKTEAGDRYRITVKEMRTAVGTEDLKFWHVLVAFDRSLGVDSADQIEIAHAWQTVEERSSDLPTHFADPMKDYAYPLPVGRWSVRLIDSVSSLGGFCMNALHNGRYDAAYFEEKILLIVDIVALGGVGDYRLFYAEQTEDGTRYRIMLDEMLSCELSDEIEIHHVLIELDRSAGVTSSEQVEILISGNR